MMVLTDIEEVFVPIVEGFLVSLDESRPMLETLVPLSYVPQITCICMYAYMYVYHILKSILN